MVLLRRNSDSRRNPDMRREPTSFQFREWIGPNETVATTRTLPMRHRIVFAILCAYKDVDKPLQRTTLRDIRRRAIL